MKTLFAFAFLFAGLLALQADHHGKAKELPACCAEGCCCTGADVCTGCACTGGPLEAQSAESDEYPLNTCVVSGEELGSMGEPIIYWHKMAGQPDREVRFCCERCQGQFESNPGKYLAKLDAAVTCCADGECAGCA